LVSLKTDQYERPEIWFGLMFQEFLILGKLLAINLWDTTYDKVLKLFVLPPFIFFQALLSTHQSELTGIELGLTLGLRVELNI
jgi:hypothetical protein